MLLRVAVPGNGVGVGGGAGPTAPPATPSVTVVARVTRAFSFPGMADAQYAAHDGRPPAAQVGRAAPPGACLPGEPLLAVPPSLCRSDMPADCGLRPYYAADADALKAGQWRRGRGDGRRGGEGGGCHPCAATTQRPLPPPTPPLR